MISGSGSSTTARLRSNPCFGSPAAHHVVDFGQNTPKPGLSPEEHRQDGIQRQKSSVLQVGAGRIYIYDDTESDASPVRVAVKDYIEQGFVVYQIYTNAMLDPLGR